MKLRIKGIELAKTGDIKITKIEGLTFRTVARRISQNRTKCAGI
jgi:hypothetical protein